MWIESTSPAIVDSTFTGSGHDGISVTGNGSPLIRNNYFYQNGANGITIYGTSRAEVRENIFEQTGFAINVNQKAAPLLVGKPHHPKQGWHCGAGKGTADLAKQLGGWQYARWAGGDRPVAPRSGNGNCTGQQLVSQQRSVLM